MTAGERARGNELICCLWRRSDSRSIEILFPLIVDNKGRVKVKTTGIRRLCGRGSA